MNDIVDADTGEIIEQTPIMDLSTLETMVRVEIDTMMATARRYPRRAPRKIQESINELATMDEEVAEEMRYALPRGKNDDGTAKVISGPSVRFAEMVAQQYGNAQIGARITEINKKDKYIEAEGVFVDSETGLRTVVRVRRRIAGNYGLYKDDMIMMTGNAAASIARRNAILQGVPKAVWNKGYVAAENVLMGTVQTLSNVRAKAIASFTRFGLDAASVLMLVGKQAEQDVGLEDVANLRSMFAQLKNQEVTVEDLMKGLKGPEAEHQTIENPLKDDDGETGPKKEAAPKKAAGKKAKAEEAPPAEQQQPADEAPPATEEQVDNSDPLPPETEAATEREQERRAAEVAKEELPPMPADDLPAGKTKEQKAEPEKPKPAAPKESPMPTDETEYDAYARAYIAEATSASELEEKFKSERKLRNACSVTSETLEVLKEELADKLTALRG